MKKNDIDLSKLKSEISSRRGAVNSAAPKDEFLFGLLSANDTGRPNNSTNRIKIFVNETAKKLNDSDQLTIDVVTTEQQSNQQILGGLKENINV
jgi:hypothetical protein